MSDRTEDYLLSISMFILSLVFLIISLNSANSTFEYSMFISAITFFISFILLVGATLGIIFTTMFKFTAKEKVELINKWLK